MKSSPDPALHGRGNTLGMRDDACELVQDRPRRVPQCTTTSPALNEVPAALVLRRISVRCVQQNVVDGSGRLVLSGVMRLQSISGEGDAFVVRLLADGTPDPTFGIGGMAVEDLPDDPRGLALDSQGRILVGGDRPSGSFARGNLIRLLINKTVRLAGPALQDRAGLAGARRGTIFAQPPSPPRMQDRP